jgi:GDP-mannose 6-dehydrogenase
MRISIFGLGYVGCTSAACLASEGHSIIGVDVNPDKVKEINLGKSPLLEKGLEELIAKSVSEGNLRATLNPKEAVMTSDVSFLCVGTPSMHNGSINIDFLTRVSSEIGTILREKEKEHLIVNRSTSLPGTLIQLGKIIEEASGRLMDKDFHIAANPEFLREGSAIQDFYNPPYTVIGCNNKSSVQVLKKIYSFLKAPLINVSVEEAELIKYTNNAFHGLKVAFANEIGRLSKCFGFDARNIMRTVVADTKLNLSPYYLKPGFAFGGSCLPKDLRALGHFAKHKDVNIPLIDSVLISNELHINHVFDLVNLKGCSNIGFIGLAFKPDTDDLRESPAVTLAERLIGKGKTLLIYDQNVYKDKLIGTNKEFVLNQLPHFFKLLTDDLKGLIENSEILIIVQRFDVLLQHSELLSSKIIIDLIGWDDLKSNCEKYIGICW